MTVVLATGELRPDGSGSVTIGPAEYVLEWTGNGTLIGLRVRLGRRVVGGGDLVRGMGRNFEGEVTAEAIRYWVRGSPEGSGENRTLKIEWSCPRVPLHERKQAPQWSSNLFADAPEAVED